MAGQRRRPLPPRRRPARAPLDPNFTGGGRTLTDDDGRYRFVTVKPGPYPWKNHHNAWRPAHIHFSLFGPAFATRLITQMYFPGDPLFPFDPIFASVPEPARQRLVATFDLDAGVPDEALAFRWDIVLRGRPSPRRRPGRAAAALTPSQTVGPFHHIELPQPGGGHLVAPDRRVPSGSSAASSTAPARRSTTR